MKVRSAIILVVVALIIGIAIGVALANRTAGPGNRTGLPSVTATSAGSPSATASGTALVLGQRTKTSGCAVHDDLPDPACSPGAVFPNVTKEQICTPGYASSVRDVPESEKQQVYAEYGIKTHRSGQYEIDHLVSLEFGGSNDIANLWPEAASPRPGFHEKDRYENYVHQQICSGAISLQ